MQGVPNGPSQSTPVESRYTKHARPTPPRSEHEHGTHRRACEHQETKYARVKHPPRVAEHHADGQPRSLRPSSPGVKENAGPATVLSLSRCRDGRRRAGHARRGRRRRGDKIVGTNVAKNEDGTLRALASGACGRDGWASWWMADACA
jgi:hypothetical protein